MEGRSEAKPDGDILYLDLDLALPSGARLNDIIDAVSRRIASSPITCGLFRSISIPPMRFNSRKLSAKAPHSSHRPAIPGGSLVWERPEALICLPRIPLTTTACLGLNSQPLTVSEADWEALYPGFPADAAGTDEEIANFLAYAFNRNPADLDTEAGQLPITFGLTEFEGLDYQYVAFDIVTRSTDLILHSAGG